MRNKPQPLHICGSRVAILQHRHRVGSDFATVTDYFWREGAPWLVLQLPDSRRAAVPAEWIDLPAGTFPPSEGRPLLCPGALAEMARLCRHLTGRARPQRRRARRPK